MMGEDGILLIMMSLQGMFCEECTKKVNTLCTNEGSGSMAITLCDSCSNVYRDVITMTDQLHDDTVEIIKTKKELT